MTTDKTTTVILRIEPGLKEALRVDGNREHRAIAYNGSLIRDC